MGSSCVRSSRGNRRTRVFEPLESACNITGVRLPSIHGLSEELTNFITSRLNDLLRAGSSLIRIVLDAPVQIDVALISLPRNVGVLKLANHVTAFVHAAGGNVIRIVETGDTGEMVCPKIRAIFWAFDGVNIPKNRSRLVAVADRALRCRRTVEFCLCDPFRIVVVSPGISPDGLLPNVARKKVYRRWGRVKNGED